MNFISKFIPSLVSLIMLLSFLNGQSRSISGDTRNFKLSPVRTVKSNIGPTMDGGRLGVNRLIDGKLPKSGWRSTWTVWEEKSRHYIRFGC